MTIALAHLNWGPVLGHRKNGQPIYAIRGGAPDDPPPSDPPADPPKVDLPKSFTQAEVNAIATREAQAAERTAQTKLLQSLGFDTPEAAKAAVDAARAAEDAGKTEVQRQQEAAAAAKTAADNDRQAAASERFEAKLERNFAKAGVDVDSPSFARIRRMVTLDTSADAAAIQAEIDTIKTDFPALFGTAGGTPPPAPGSDPHGRPPATPPGSKTAMERGRERAKATSPANAGGGYLKPPGL